MRKFLLTLCCVLFTVGAATAQVYKYYAGHQYFQMSPNGRYLVEDQGEYLAVFNRDESALTEFAPDDDYTLTYSAGLGHCLANDGTLVGSYCEEAGVLKGGEWTNLPVTQGEGNGMSMAHAITPDGKRICGNVGVDNADVYSGALSIEPAVWTLNGDTYQCTVLPHPATDFMGQTPQYVTAVDISEDGKTVVGQVQSGNGFYPMPIVYREAADGSWSYELIGESTVYNAEALAECPKYPSYEPEYVSAEDYLSETDLAAYNEAYQAYQDALADYHAGNIEYSELPKYPSYWQYITGENKEKWQADSLAYREAASAYSDSLDAWEDYFYSNVVTGNAYDFNGVHLSGNGQYYATVVTSEGEDFWSTNATPASFNLTADGTPISLTEITTQNVAAVTNDGMLLTCSPYMEYMRQASVVKPGETQSTRFDLYLEEKGYTEAVSFLKENCLYDVPDYSGDEVTTVTDSLVMGSMVANSDGTIFLSYLYDEYSDSNDQPSASYILDLNADAQPDAIGEVRKDEALEAKVLRREYFNLAGQRIAAPRAGVYLEKVVTSTGVRTYKRVK